MENLKPCPFKVGDKVNVSENSEYFSDWRGSDIFICGISIDENGTYNICIREAGVRGSTDGWKIEDLDHIDNTRPIEDRLMQSVQECAMRELLATRKVEELQSQIDRLQTQLSGITQYGSIEAAEKIDRLTKERDRLLGAIHKAMHIYDNGTRDVSEDMRDVLHDALEEEN